MRISRAGNAREEPRLCAQWCSLLPGVHLEEPCFPSINSNSLLPHPTRYWETRPALLHGSQSPSRHRASHLPDTFKQKCNKFLSRQLPCHPSTFLENSTTANCIPKHTPCRWERKSNEVPAKRQHSYISHRPATDCVLFVRSIPIQTLTTSCCTQTPRYTSSVSDFKSWI